VRFLHVTSVSNRASITEHGLDWSRMSEARGIAGGVKPEEEGCFVCRDRWEAGFFVDMNNTGGPVDIWAIDGIEERDLIDGGSGFFYVPGTISPDRVTLVEQDLPGGRQGPKKFGPA
jgi:hypothetical protein